MEDGEANQAAAKEYIALLEESLSDLAEALLLHLLTGSGELRHLADVGGLGGLTAGVGVHLGIEDKDVDILAAFITSPKGAEVFGDRRDAMLAHVKELKAKGEKPPLMECISQGA